MAMSPFSGRLPSRRNAGNARVFILLIVCFLVGAGLSALLVSKSQSRDVPEPAQAAKAASLSPESKAILGRLDVPVEVRLYAILDPTTVSESMQEYARRVGALLNGYEVESGGKLIVRQFVSEADEDARAAAADGIRAFNRERGRACYLGLAVAHSSQKETISTLSPVWEAALEADISRAIERVLTKPAVTVAQVVPVPLDPSVEQAVRQAIPDLEQVSLEEANRRLRQAALEEFARAISDLAPAVKEAEQRIRESQSEAESLAARNALQALQGEQTKRLQELAAKSQSQVEALQQLKSAR